MRTSLAIIFASWNKETREALRDKRALFLTLVVPLVFYPAMLGLTGWMQHNQLKKEASKPLEIGVLNQFPSIGFPETEGVEWVRTDSLERRDRFSFFVHVKEKLDDTFHLEIYYRDTAQGEFARDRVQKVLSEIEGGLIEKRLIGAGLDQSFIEPLSVEWNNQASVRESTGSRWGGLGAYFVVFLAFTGCLSVAIDTGAGEKERGTLEAILATPAELSYIVLGKLAHVMVMGLLSVIATMIGMGALITIGASSGGVGNIQIDSYFVLSTLCLVLSIIGFFASALLSLSLRAKTIKEAHMRGSLMLLFVALILMYATLPGVEYSYSLIWVPVLNVALALRAAIEGSLTVWQWFLTMLVTLALTLGWLLWTSRLIRYRTETAFLKD